jgi:hypothetical protein
MSHDQPLYYVEQATEDPVLWRVVGPNGVVDTYGLESEAQSRADRLNEEIAEEREDDS